MDNHEVRMTNPNRANGASRKDDRRKPHRREAARPIATTGPAAIAAWLASSC